MRGGRNGYRGWGDPRYGKPYFYGNKDLGLSDEQKKQLETIRRKAVEKSRNVPPEQRRMIFEQMKKEMDKVFTPEQLEKIKKSRRRGPMPGRRFGPPRGGHGGKDRDRDSRQDPRSRPDDKEIGML